MALRGCLRIKEVYEQLDTQSNPIPIIGATKNQQKEELHNYHDRGCYQPHQETGVDFAALGLIRV
jgi:hypothetical protein